MTALGGLLQSQVAQRHGAVQESANLMRQALHQINWDERRPAMRCDGWAVYLDDSVQYFAAFVDDVNKRIITSDKTWTTLSYDADALDCFLDDMQVGGLGMHFIGADADPYSRAVREEAKVTGGDVVRAKDALTQLTEQAKALVVQAASLNAGATDVQAQAFAVRYARLREDYADIERRMAQLRASIDLAGTAIVDAASSR